MYVVRPPGMLTTPAAIAAALGCKAKKYPNPAIDRVFHYGKSFFMTNVHPGHTTGAPPEFTNVHSFFAKHKYGQRQALENAGVSVPAAFGSAAAAIAHSASVTDDGLCFVIRPLRHSGGEHYRVSDGSDLGANEYASVLYPKKREYRVIFVFGKPLIYLRKKPNEGVAEDAPWGHVNSKFQTINDIPNCRLSQTDCVERLSALDVVKYSHVVAADILYNSKEPQPYVVLELNMCPSLSIADNLAKVVEAVNARS
jgi:hypothetical protein